MLRLNQAIGELSPFHYAGAGYSIRLDNNESFVEPSVELRRAMAEAVCSADLRAYPDEDCKELCAAFAARYGVETENVMVGNGSDELIKMLVGAVVPAGGLVLAPELDFGGYFQNAKIYGKRTASFPRREDYSVAAEDLLKECRERRPDLVIFSNPSNPSGSIVRREAVLRLAREAGCLVVVDEAYADFAAESVLHDTAAFENLVVLRTLSKACGLAGARIGFAVSNPELTVALRSVRDAYNVSTCDQRVALAVLRDPAHREDSIREILRMRGVLMAGLRDAERQLPGRFRVFPTESNFALIECPEAKAVQQFLYGRGIAVRVFGEGLIRVNAGNEAQMAAFFEALGNYFQIQIDFGGKGAAQ